jgi:hypothetical protein
MRQIQGWNVSNVVVVGSDIVIVDGGSNDDIFSIVIVIDASAFDENVASLTILLGRPHDHWFGTRFAWTSHRIWDWGWFIISYCRKKHT